MVVPGQAESIAVWDPTGDVGTSRKQYHFDDINPIEIRRFPVTLVNAIGGQFPGGGILAVVHAGHLPSEFRVAVKPTEQRHWSEMTVRRTPPL